MIRNSTFSLRSFTLSSATWFAAVTLGCSVILLALVKVFTTDRIEQVPAFVMIAVLIVVLELLPLVQGRGHDPQGVVMSTAFVCTMLFMWGPYPAIVAVAVASLASDLRMRKSWWKLLFNPCQYALSVAVAALAIRLASHAASLAHPLPTLSIRDLAWIPAAWLAYFVVNLFLVAGAVSYTQSFRSIVSNDFTNYTLMSFSVMALSPLVIVIGQNAWALLPLLLIPLLLLYHTSAMSLEREHEAGHDALTGLPNRISLRFELDNALAGYERDDTRFALMLIDLDDFKRVNDTLGHQVGDALLAKFADRLRQRVRPDDIVARLGGDEFAVITYDTGEMDGLTVAQRLLDSIEDPIDLEGISLEIAASVGIVVCPDHGTDSSDLLRRADVAMYSAKDERSRIELYHPTHDRNSTDRLSLLGELRQALLDGDLVMHYQPKVSTADGTPMGVEALVRWRHPVRGFIPPDEFIPLAERSGIMPLLTEQVVGLALKQAAKWRDEGMMVPVAVNIAPTDLTRDDLVYVVAQKLREYNLPAAMLNLEITERIVTHQLEDAKRNLMRMRDMGVKISLDDFGTGYSSLSRLGALQVDEIKIDRGFVAEISQGERAIGIVRTLIDLAHAFGIPAIAEGIETAEELATLHALGCDGVQGWYIALPMPDGQATAWLRARTDQAVPDDEFDGARGAYSPGNALSFPATVRYPL